MVLLWNEAFLIYSHNNIDNYAALAYLLLNYATT